ncbi:MAG: hypothetical protein OEY14_16520, partial [Myxococcales bacterium]|nr:hypothetical protein [Myxococcales bacterium]
MCSLLRPLKVRPETYYRCHGDGLCCTDIHLLGPLSEREIERLRLVDPAVVVRCEGAEDHGLSCRSEEGCIFLSEQGCSLHEVLDGSIKPNACHRFPLDLTATPTGGRITMDHRCPCRSMGRGPLLEAEVAEPSLLDEDEELLALHFVEEEVELSEDATISFSAWERYEATLLRRLLGGEAPEQVLGVEPFGPLTQGSWRQTARTMHALDGSTRAEVAFQ